MRFARARLGARIGPAVGAWLGIAAATATMAHAETVDVRLTLDGRDVTGAFDAEVGFFDVALPKDAPPSFECRAGVRTVVPIGTFRLDVKSDEVVPASRPFFTSDGKPSSAVQELRMQVVRAGLLRTPAGSYPAGSRVDVLSTRTGTLYQRRIGRDPSIVPVPAEPSVAGVLDPARRLIGFVRIDPAAGEVFELPALPRLQRGSGQLHVSFRYASDFEEKGPTLAPFLVTERGKLPADVLVDRGGSLDGFWFDAPATDGFVQLESPVWTTANVVRLRVPDRAALSLGSVPVGRRPPLTVSFDAARGFESEPVALDLLDCRTIEDFTGPPDLSRCTHVATRQGLGKDEFRFERLALSTYALRWKSAGLSDFTRVNVREAVPMARTLRIEPVEVRGAVSRGGGPVGQARVSFLSAAGVPESETETGRDGSYRLELPRPGLYAVRIDSSGRLPFETTASVETGKDVDFLIPRNEVRVRVVESQGGKPVKGASVAGLMFDGEGNSTWNVVTAANGEVTLPPVPDGTLQLKAAAEGYEPSGPSVLTVDSETGERLVEIRLAPADGRRLALYEASGAPASGATIVVPGFSDVRAGQDGVAVLPSRVPDGIGLFAWDRAGRLAFFRLSASRDETVRFGPSGPPIRLRAARPDGSPVWDWVPMVSIDGIGFPGPSEQGRLAGSDLWARRDGTLRLAGFPERGVLVVAPEGHPELAMTRALPVDDEIVFFIPVPGRQ